MGNVRHSTRRTVTCAFARKDTQGNIVKRVRHNLVYIYNTASNLTDGVILFHYRRMIQRFVFSLQAGLLSLDSQTAMAKIGCVTMVDGGMTNKLPLER